MGESWLSRNHRAKTKHLHVHLLYICNLLTHLLRHWTQCFYHNSITAANNWHCKTHGNYIKCLILLIGWSVGWRNIGVTKRFTASCKTGHFKKQFTLSMYVVETIDKSVHFNINTYKQIRKEKTYQRNSAIFCFLLHLWKNQSSFRAWMMISKNLTHIKEPV